MKTKRKTRNYSSTGWWFRTFIFPYQLGISNHPNWLIFFFQRVVFFSTTKRSVSKVSDQKWFLFILSRGIPIETKQWGLETNHQAASDAWNLRYQLRKDHQIRELAKVGRAAAGPGPSRLGGAMKDMEISMVISWDFNENTWVSLDFRKKAYVIS